MKPPQKIYSAQFDTTRYRTRGSQITRAVFSNSKNLIKPNCTSLFLIVRPGCEIGGFFFSKPALKNSQLSWQGCDDRGSDFLKMISVMQCPPKFQMLHVTFETSRTSSAEPA
jgi:hypothetical protein